jgi:Flp pilus assembly protein TadD
VALQSAGKVDQAIVFLEKAHQRHPGDRSLLLLLVSYLQGQRDLDRAIHYAQELATLVPVDPQAQRLLEQLRRQRRR